MTWDEHLDELNRIRGLCERNRHLLPDFVYQTHMEYLAALEQDRWCKGEDPYGSLRSALAVFIELEPDLAGYNAGGYPVTVREADKRIRAHGLGRRSDRLLGYASWIQVNGWRGLDPELASVLRGEYRQLGIDPEAIDFTMGD